MVDEASLLFTAVCPSDLQMKVVPPRTGPCAGKRRPRPGGLLRGKAPPREDEASCETSAEEIARLQSVLSSLNEQAELPRSELQNCRTQLPKVMVEAEVQTEPDPGDFRKSCAAAEDACEVQREQLDALHQEVGDKSRELRRSQDTVKLLRAELEQQRQVSEQYRLQTEMLEEQLRQTSDRLKRSESKNAEARHTSSSSTLTPCSVSLPKSWKDSSGSRCFSDDGEDSPEEKAACPPKGEARKDRSPTQRASRNASSKTVST
mmetsp:Transcript_61296/g.143453  ORF Transcript_61296/g.143453 Transcript_61296/m.143453 type:complete len:262 (+) Transcript_61296:38-823(+)